MHCKSSFFNRRPGRLYLFSGPSGVGKSTLMEGLLNSKPDDMEKVVAYTTRLPRPGEMADVHYHYVTPDTFEAKKATFLEVTEFAGNAYAFGLTRQQVLEKLSGGRDLLADMDYSRLAFFRKEISGCYSIFLLPPDMASLRSRLQGRGDAEEVIERRMKHAQEIMDHKEESDKIFYNLPGKQAETIAEAAEQIARRRLNDQIMYCAPRFFLLKSLEKAIVTRYVAPTVKGY